jgi:hypothetical protein
VDQENSSNGKINMIIAEGDYERNKTIYKEQEKAETLKRET